MSKITLTEVPLLKDLTDKELSLVSSFLIEKEYKQGDKIFSRNSIRDKVAIITSGLAAIKNDINKKQVIALFKQNDSLGEMSLIEKNSQHIYDTEAASEKLNTLELSVYNW